MQVKNNVLWHAIFDKYGSVQAFCRAHKELKISASIVGDLLCFKLYPFKKVRSADSGGWCYSNEYRGVCLVLEKILRIPVEDLFPKRLYDHLVGTKTKKAVEVSSFTALPAATQKEILALPAPVEEPSDFESDKELLRVRIKDVLKTLSYREREILKLRYGISDGCSYTLEEVAQIFKVDRKRVRQIEQKAIRKLQQPSRSEQLTPFL
jgi:RNA polymerase sigma factor (sigma-70 family)